MRFELQTSQLITIRKKGIYFSYSYNIQKKAFRLNETLFLIRLSIIYFFNKSLISVSKISSLVGAGGATGAASSFFLALE